MMNLTSFILTGFLFLTIEVLVTSNFVKGDEHFRHTSRLEKRSPAGAGANPFFASQESSEGHEFMTSDELNEEKKSGRRNLIYIGKREGKSLDDMRRVKEQSDTPLRRSRIYIGKRSDADVYDLDGSDASQFVNSDEANWKYDPLSYHDDVEGRQLRFMPTNYYLNKRRSRLYIG